MPVMNCLSPASVKNLLDRQRGTRAIHGHSDTMPCTASLLPNTII